MNRLLNLKNLFVACLLTAALGVAGASSARACDVSRPAYRPIHDQYEPATFWKTVTVWTTTTEPQVEWVTRYDDCGRPYQARIVTERVVRVPVQKRILVSY